MTDQDPYVVETYTDEWGIPLEQLNESDIDDEDGDMILEQHLTVYNEAAMTRLLDDFKVDDDLEPFERVSVTTAEPVHIKDVFDDLSREEAFYNQALDAARSVLKQTKEHDVPFLPPVDNTEPKIRDRQAKQAGKTAKPGKKAAAEKEAAATEELIDKVKLAKRKRKDVRDDDFMLDAVDFDPEDMEDNDRKNKYKRNSPNVKLNRMGKQSKKQPQSQQKRKSPKGRPGKARRMAMRNRR
ncbi:predicted protein [Lichtheimia corymbifera JMRC:FSU:9682]|uniref:Uncharacterized protein n=1 Tax=Lichtheimia corymbifera JMRC:FSU:9682 TaxID=1263082 RepID=A0A068SAA6_9FUNG|nr:predicted protein [Lichtheimia corymbifera JMRC:FSU:9682]